MTQSTHYPSATYDGETLFLIEGTLSELQVALTKASLLAQIEKNSQSKKRNRYSRCSPRMHAMVANSEALVFFDYDDPDKGIYNYNFAAAVGEHILCGAMEHANNFHNGEPVKAVVSRRGDVLFAHAIMQVKTLKFYMPRGEYAGREALFKSRKRTAFWLASLTSISFPVMFYFARMLDEQKNNISYKVWLLPTLIIATGSFLYYFINVFKERRVLQYPSYAEAVFEVFGFPNPRSINLLKVAIGFRNTGWRHAWQADLLMPEIDEKSELKPSGTANRHLGR